MFIFRPGTVLKTHLIPNVLEKSWTFVCSYVNVGSLITKINIYIDIYSSNQTIVSYSFVSFKVYSILKISQKVLEKSWKSIGQHVYESCVKCRSSLHMADVVRLFGGSIPGSA